MVEPSPVDAPTYYANNVWVELSNWDVKIRLGQMLSASSDELRVREIATVFMSHPHAVAFLQSLQSVLQKLPELQKALKAEDVLHG